MASAQIPSNSGSRTGSRQVGQAVFMLWMEQEPDQQRCLVLGPELRLGVLSKAEAAELGLADVEVASETMPRPHVKEHGGDCRAAVRTATPPQMGHSEKVIERTRTSGWWILHVDMDSFLAAVEVRRRPELRGLPVIVGGDGDPTRPRQVVATASYEARAYGVRSGMPMQRALRKCPAAVFLPSDHPAYESASAEVMEVLRSFGYPVEVWGWDEAFIGAQHEVPEELARAVRTAVYKRTGLTCAVGIGDTKERAKMATSFAKSVPGHIYRLDSSNWIRTMGDRDVAELWGIGKRTATRLAAYGLRTVADLALADREDLAEWFGPTIGPRLRILARGGGSRTVTTEPWLARSKSRQVTFPSDLTDAAAIADQVAAMARELTAEVNADGRLITHVGVTVRTRTFFTQVKTGKLPEMTVDPDVVETGARQVLARFEISRPVRLLGVRLDLLVPAGH
jgi:DNA polymerase IV